MESDDARSMVSDRLLVRHHDERDAGFVQPLEELHDLDTALTVQVARRLVSQGTLSATTSYDAIRTLDAVSICVPTPLSKSREPDITYILQASNEIASRMHAPMAIVLESTSYPGTTEELVLPILERSGLKVGRDFYLAFSPERVDPGNMQFHTKNTPKIIGGVTPQCCEMVQALYSQAVENVVPVSSAMAAEMVKLLENTFRAINIGAINEMAIICHQLGVDIWEIIEAAKTKPFGFMPFYPGPGLGGHCIPIDPLYLSWKMRKPFALSSSVP